MLAVCNMADFMSTFIRVLLSRIRFSNGYGILSKVLVVKVPRNTKHVLHPAVRQ